jgi:hypothetical protein
VAQKNATKNEHICSMCIQINKVGKQEAGILWVQIPADCTIGDSVQVKKYTSWLNMNHCKLTE